jgi:hypothetical protein
MHVGALDEVRKFGLVPYRHERQKSRTLLAQDINPLLAIVSPTPKRR